MISWDGKHTGNIEKVLTAGEGDRITHVLISQRLFVKEKKLLPIGWIGTLDEDEVRLIVGSSTIERLSAYKRE